MNGYFSRIARQSGVRFPGAGKRPGLASAGRGDQTAASIERDETVMVPATRPVASRAPDTAGKNIEAAAPPKPRQMGRTEIPVRAVDPVASEKVLPASVAASVPPVPVVEEVTLTGPNPETPPEVRLESTPHKTVEYRSEDVQVIAEDRSTGAVDSVEPVIDEGRPEAAQTKFFEKTSEIIEGRDADATEIQTVLIREVQEWIAAGQLSSEDEGENVGTAVVTMPAKERRTQTIEREAGVVRIVEGSPQETEIEMLSKPAPTSPINEQNFEISIGSISVVVEGDDAVPQPAAPAVAPARASTGATQRRVSRLSRHYL